VITRRTTYRWLFKPIVFLLLTAFLLPAGLHAGQLADFCMSEMASHHTPSEHARQNCHDDGNHETDTASDSHQLCGSLAFCTCKLDEAPINNKSWLISSTGSVAILPVYTTAQKPVTVSESIAPDLRSPINRHAPPLWLLYDTYLL
jgi:hypothetical protein